MKLKRGHTILLGGIGGDSHSVGLSILRQSLLMNNYTVHYMGTQNRLEDFIQVAALANVVMISSMDGHSRYYLREFPKLLRDGTLLKLSGTWEAIYTSVIAADTRIFSRDGLQSGFREVC